MSHSLHNLKRPPSNKRPKKRVGRGNGSGKGTYAGRGLKGQKSRSGGRARLRRRSMFHQFLMRTPKLRGFKRQSALVAIVNVGNLAKHFASQTVITPELLIKNGLTRKTAGGIKILGSGILKKQLHIKAHAFSAAAKDSITAAGGTWEIIK